MGNCVESVDGTWGRYIQKSQSINTQICLGNIHSDR